MRMPLTTEHQIYIKEKLIELYKEIDESTIKAGNFNTPLLEVDRSHRKKISKHIVELNNSIN